MYGMDYINAEREQQHAYLRQTVMGHVQRHPQVGSRLWRCGPACARCQQLFAGQQCAAAGLYGAVLCYGPAQPLVVIVPNTKKFLQAGITFRSLCSSYLPSDVPKRKPHDAGI